jgi:hypothetical protein
LDLPQFRDCIVHPDIADDEKADYPSKNRATAIARRPAKKMKKSPNQAPEPTPLRVTPAADAPVAPRSVAARL